MSFCDDGFRHSYEHWTYEHWTYERWTYEHSTYGAKIRRWCDVKSCGCSCGHSSPCCWKICGHCCGRPRRAGVSCFRSCDRTIRTVSASYRWNDWTFWLQPLQSSVLGEFAYQE